ncbi:hypothetical protein ACFWV1_33395 [Streptomyces sp. NPDC058700]|uniref:hypothetical protein n=1 Tax=unclassified Streptomyces TaxID=2593676 RepID=UPI00365D2D26
MSHHDRHGSEQDRHEPPRTTPSGAEGESGDAEARRQAEEATRDQGDSSAEDAHGSTAKRQSPGIGREEQREQHP